MKIIKSLQNTSANAADSLIKPTTSKTRAKQHIPPKIRLNVARAERVLLQRAGKQTRKRVRRGPLERMFKIHQLIADGKYPNAMALAFHLEVSHKTICRDIEYMRDHYLLPIQFDFARAGYFYSEKVDGFPGAPGLTSNELSALLVGSKAIEQYHGIPFQQPLQTALEKLAGRLDEEDRIVLEDSEQAVSFRPFAPEHADRHVFVVVTHAQRERRILEFTYRKPGTNDPSLRRVHPYHVMCRDNRWYLFGLDEGHSDVRTFALTRIAKPVTTNEQFSEPEDFDPDEYLRGSFNVMKGDGDYEVVIEFDAWLTDVLRGRQWHSTQEITPLPGGASQMKMRLTALEEVERWILSWGTHAKAIGPTELIARITATIRQLASHYPTQ